MSTNALFRFRDFSWIAERVWLRFRLRSIRMQHVRELEDALEQWIRETSECGYPCNEAGEESARRADD